MMDPDKIPSDIVEMSLNNSKLLDVMADYYKPFASDHADILRVLSGLLLAPTSRTEKIREGANELIKDFNLMIEVSNFLKELKKEKGRRK